MRLISDYIDFVSALKDKQSEDSVIRNEAKNALGILRQKYPEQYAKYKAQFEGAELQNEPQDETTKTKRAKDGIAFYIQEHPEIDIEEVRNKARARLIKGQNGQGLRFDLPIWITEKDVLISLELLDLPELITAKGNLVQRETLLRRCILRAVADKRIDEATFDIRQLAKKALNYIKQMHDRFGEYPLPVGYGIGGLKKALEIISDDELFSIFNGHYINADKLYEMCIKNLSPIDAVYARW